MTTCALFTEDEPEPSEYQYSTYYNSTDNPEMIVPYPLMHSIAYSGRYFAKINGKYYSLHHNHSGNFLFKYVKGEKTLVPVNLWHGEEFDGHMVEIYYSPSLWTHKLIFFFRFYKYKNKNHKVRNNMMYVNFSQKHYFI